MGNVIHVTENQLQRMLSWFQIERRLGLAFPKMHMVFVGRNILGQLVFSIMRHFTVMVITSDATSGSWGM